MHKKQKYGKKDMEYVFEILGHSPYKQTTTSGGVHVSGDYSGIIFSSSPQKHKAWEAPQQGASN